MLICIAQQLSAIKAYFGTSFMFVCVCVFVSVVGAKYAQFSGLHTNLTTSRPLAPGSNISAEETHLCGCGASGNAD